LPKVRARVAQPLAVDVAHRVDDIGTIRVGEAVVNEEIAHRIAEPVALAVFEDAGDIAEADLRGDLRQRGAVEARRREDNGPAEFQHLLSLSRRFSSGFGWPMRRA
jgi:hypothetical protein